MCETQTDRSQTMLSLNAFCSVNRNIIWQLLSKNGHFLKKDFVGKYKEVCIGKYERGTCLTCPIQDLLLFYFFLSFSSLEELTNLPMRYVALCLCYQWKDMTWCRLSPPSNRINHQQNHWFQWLLRIITTSSVLSQFLLEYTYLWHITTSSNLTDTGYPRFS